MSDINNMNVGPRWYVAHTYSGYENKVKTNLEKIIENRHLEHLIFDIFIPVETVVEMKEVKKSKGKKKVDNEGDNEEESPEMEEKIVENKIFPSYVLIKMTMTDESWHVVRNIRGVTGFVGPGSKPEPLTDEEVAALISEEHIAAAEPLKVGDTVAIVGGLFAAFNYVGTLSDISENGEDVTVMVSTTGRVMPVKLNMKEIKKVEE